MSSSIEVSATVRKIDNAMNVALSSLAGHAIDQELITKLWVIVSDVIDSITSNFSLPARAWLCSEYVCNGVSIGTTDGPKKLSELSSQNILPTLESVPFIELMQMKHTFVNTFIEQGIVSEIDRRLTQNDRKTEEQAL